MPEPLSLADVLTAYGSSPPSGDPNAPLTPGEVAGWAALPRPHGVPQLTITPSQGDMPISPYVERAAGDVAANVGSRIASIPQRAFESSENLRLGGTSSDAPAYDPGPVLEAASYMTGVGAPFAETGALGSAGGRLLRAGEEAAAAERATFPQYAESYPPVGPPQLISKATERPVRGDLAPGDPQAERMIANNKAFWSKVLTPEAEEFQKVRAGIAQDVARGDYEPYFDPAARAPVDPADYPTNLDMAAQALPAKPETIAKYQAMYDTPQARARLAEAHAAGQTVPEAENWYWMKQLQDKYVNELGDVEGKRAFAREFADAMAATTGGQTPTANYLMAHYAEFMRARGEPIPASHQLPFPIGGRYAGSNLAMYEKTAGSPEFSGFGPENPKRFDFSGSFKGYPSSATIDEQMSNLIVPGMQKPIGESYGVASGLVRDMAERAGVAPQNYQDVSWAGAKKLLAEAAGKKFDYEGPMISHVNAAIERTHRLTGMPREEIVRRGVIRKEIPLYAAGGLAAPLLTGPTDQGPVPQ